MTTRRKSETQSPVNYWWNEFLFVKHFIVETDMPPKAAVTTCAGCIMIVRVSGIRQGAV